MIKKVAAHQYIYHTRGVCPPEIHFRIEDGYLRELRFVGGGCPGNAQLVSRLLEGKSLAEVMGYIKGIECRNDTSCPHELACAIEAVGDGTLEAADSFKVQADNQPRQSIAIIGHPAGDNTRAEKVLEHIRDGDVDAIYCLGNITGDSLQNEKLIKPRSRDWLLQLPQVLSFRLKDRKCMAFFGEYIQSFPDFSDFEPFALEMNMVCGLTRFMQDETVFPALEAMIPQFQADVIIFSQMKTWDCWHIGDTDFISVGQAWDESGLAWGLLREKNGRADLKIMSVPS